MTRISSRRGFLRRTTHAAASLGALGALSRQAHAEEKTDIRILDTHQHLWDLEKFRLAWLKDAPSLARDYVLADYMKAASGLNVVKTIYMEVDVVEEQQDAEVDYVLGLCRRNDNPVVGAVVSGRPGSSRFEKYVSRFKDEPHIKGVRRILHPKDLHAGHCLETQFVKSVRLLGTLGLSFDICIRAGELPDVAKLVAACPDTSFILDHCGNPDLQSANLDAWRRDIGEVARHGNVVCKVSGFVASAKKDWTSDDLAPIVHHVYEEFGPERVVFGSDWPVCNLTASYRRWVEALKKIVKARSLKERQQLFYENAARVYKVV